MPNQAWVGPLITSQVDGSAVTTNGSDTSMLPPAAIFTLPANTLAIGSMFRIRAWGRISNIATTPGTVTFTVYFGSVKAWTSSAMNLNIVAKTNVAFLVEIDLVVRSIGNGTVATIMGIGHFLSESIVGSVADTAGGSGELLMPLTAPAVGTGFDSTISQAIDVRANFSVTGNSLTCHVYSLESLN